MATITLQELERRQLLRLMESQNKAPSRPQPANAAPAPPPAAKAKDSPPPKPRIPHQTKTPLTYITVEPKPLSAYDDNPVLNENGAAFVLGVSADLLKKWRYRKQGPNYIQYGPGGPVRYEIKELLAFRDYYKIYLNSK